MKKGQKLKSQKGIAGINIAVGIIVLFMFVSFVAVIFYNTNSSSKEIELKSKATNLAVTGIEEMKAKGYEAIKDLRKGAIYEEKDIEEGFHRIIQISDYADEDEENRVAGIVKKVNVQIQYMFKGQKEQVELSTMLTKEN